MRLIDADSVIEKLNAVYKDHCKPEKYSNDSIVFSHGIEAAIKIIKEAPTENYDQLYQIMSSFVITNEEVKQALAKGEWISLKDEFPEVDTDVLMAHVMIDHIDKYDVEHKEDIPTGFYWRPLPKKENQNGHCRIDIVRIDPRTSHSVFLRKV